MTNKELINIADSDTYTQYNEGWDDALDYIDSKMGVCNDN